MLPESRHGLDGRGLFRPPSPTHALSRNTFHQAGLLRATAPLGSLCLILHREVFLLRVFPDLTQGFVFRSSTSCRCSSPGAGWAARGGHTGNRGSISSSSLSPGGHGPVQQQAEAPAQPAQPGDRCPHIGDPPHLGNGLAWHSPSGALGTAAGCPPAYRLWLGPSSP